MVTCGDDAPSLRAPDLRIWKQHCAAFAPRIESYRKKYLSVAAPFLARLRPAGLPTTVVYPFGGGDLLSALTTYPDATDITTLSLELTGDPPILGSARRIERAKAAAGENERDDQKNERRDGPPAEAETNRGGRIRPPH